MALQAQPDGCQEAAMGMGDAYFPCNKPATKVIGYKGRSDQPIRMCDMCANHNVKNRGGYEVSVYPPPEVITPKNVKVRLFSYVPQETNYPAEVVRRYEDRLPKPFFVVLMGAAAGEGYREIATRINVPVGTIKSRTNRARKAIAALIDAESGTASAQPSTVLGSG